MTLPLQKLNAILDRHAVIEARLAGGPDSETFVALSRELAELDPVVTQLKAYRAADATFLQPFGDLKVPLGAIVGWLVLGQVPSVWFWPGAALIILASLFLYLVEGRERPSKLAAA